MPEQDALRVLGLAPGTSPEEIRQHYLDLVRVWHPDRFGSDTRLREKAERTLQEINAAYTRLEGSAPPRPEIAPEDVAPPPPPPPQKAQSTGVLTPVTVGLGAACAAIGAVIGVVVAMFLVEPQGPTEPIAPAQTAVSQSGASSAIAVEQAGAVPDPDPRLLGDPARPESGTEIVPAVGAGLGQFAIENLTSRDAVVLLNGGTAHARGVYVRSGEKVTALNVPAGSYRILVAHGVVWRAGRFTADAAYREFDSPADFAERDTPAGVDYTSLTLTLQTIDGALALTRPVDPFSLSSGR